MVVQRHSVNMGEASHFGGWCHMPQAASDGEGMLIVFLSQSPRGASSPAGRAFSCPWFYDIERLLGL